MKNRNQKSYVPIKDVLIDSFQQIEKMYIEKLENGLTVIIVPKNNLQKKY